MQDLNDLRFFAAVVEHRGFTAAARVLGVPKSRLSRRVAHLEERLGIRLIQRSSRRFAVTEIGGIYHRHCLAMVAEAEAAQEAIDRIRAEPQGTIRVSCPVTLAQSGLAGVLPRFLADHPRVRVRVEATNRRVEVIEEGFDVAIRVRTPPLDDSDLVVKVLMRDTGMLVAAPALLRRLGPPGRPAGLARFDSAGMSRPGDDHAWHLTGSGGEAVTVPHRPRLVTDEMMILRQAALEGFGIVSLPLLVVGADLAAGRLQAVLPDWRLAGGIIHAVFPSRRGLLPAVRLFLDMLGSSFVESVRAAEAAILRCPGEPAPDA